MADVLIVDDEADIRDLISDLLGCHTLYRLGSDAYSPGFAAC